MVMFGQGAQAPVATASVRLPGHDGSMAMPSAGQLLGADLGLFAVSTGLFFLFGGISPAVRSILAWSSIISSLVAFVMFLYLWATFLRHEVELMRGTYRLVPMHAAIMLLSLIGAFWGAAVTFAVLPRFQDSPLRSVGFRAPQPTGGDEARAQAPDILLPLCFAGRWFAVAPSSTRAVVCEAPKDAMQTALPEVEQQTVIEEVVVTFEGSYFFSPKFVVFDLIEARLFCSVHGAKLADISTSVENQAVRQVCGARECWMDLPRPPDGAGGEQVAPPYSNWEVGEPMVPTPAPGAASMNSLRFCSEDLFEEGYELHRSFRVTFQVLAMVSAAMHFVVPLVLLAVIRNLVKERDISDARLTFRCDACCVFWLSLEALGAIAAFVMLCFWYGVRDGSHTGGKDGHYPPGGPVLCLADADHLGYDSAEACEEAFRMQMGAFLVGGAALFTLELVLGIANLRSAKKLKADILALAAAAEAAAVQAARAASGITEEDTAAALPMVIGSPIAARSVPNVADLALGSTCVHETWDPALWEICERIRAGLDHPPEFYFQALDLCGSGRITPMDLEKFLRQREPRIQRHQVGQIWRRADRNGDGMVDAEEFQALFGYFGRRRPAPAQEAATATADAAAEAAGAPLEGPPPPPSSLSAVLVVHQDPLPVDGDQLGAELPSISSAAAAPAEAGREDSAVSTGAATSVAAEAAHVAEGGGASSGSGAANEEQSMGGSAAEASNARASTEPISDHPA